MDKVRNSVARMGGTSKVVAGSRSAASELPMWSRRGQRRLLYEDATDIAAWLIGLGLERYVEAFDANDVDAAVLRTLSADDLKGAWRHIARPSKKLLEAIAALQEPARPTATPAEAGTAATPRDAERRQRRCCSATWWARPNSPRASIPRTCAR